MTVDISSEILIRRPRETVASFAADPANAPLWYVNIEAVEWKSPPPLQVGTQLSFVAHFLGRRLAYTYTIRDFIPGERLVMKTSEGPFPMETTYGWESVGSDTRMTLTNRGEPAGFSRWLAPFVSRAVRSANRKDLERLKSILEGSERF